MFLRLVFLNFNCMKEKRLNRVQVLHSSLMVWQIQRRPSCSDTTVGIGLLNGWRTETYVIRRWPIKMPCLVSFSSEVHVCEPIAEWWEARLDRNHRSWDRVLSAGHRASSTFAKRFDFRSSQQLYWQRPLPSSQKHLFPMRCVGLDESIIELQASSDRHNIEATKLNHDKRWKKHPQ